MSNFQAVLEKLEGDARRQAIQQQSDRKRKSETIAFVLAVCLGMFGAHHFYLGRTIFGVTYFLTLGLCGVGYIVDLFRISSLVDDVNNNADDDDEYFEEKTNADAYILWFPCGILGFHHFYLGNYGLGVVYFLTFGVYGIGWITDFFRIPSLVSIYNSPPENVPKEKSQTTAYLFALSPFGILGLHHYYLDRWKWGILYTLTGGVFGIGWLMDLCRVPCLISRANKHLRGESLGVIYVDDVYLLWFSFGLFGAHHLYLGRRFCATLYITTFGLFGIGWIFDIFRIPCLVSTKNNHFGDDDDEIEYAKQDTFVSTIYDAKREDTEERDLNKKEIVEKTLDLDLSHFVIRNNSVLRQATQKKTENSFFQPLESPIHRRSFSTTSLAGKLGPKRASSVRSDKTKVTIIPLGKDTESDDEYSKTSDVGVTKVLTTPRDDDLSITRIVTTPRNDDVYQKQRVSTPRSGAEGSQNICRTPRRSDVDIKQKMTTPRMDEETAMDGVITPRGCDVSFSQDVITPGMSDEMENGGAMTPRDDDIKLKQRIKTSRRSDETDNYEATTPRGDDVKLKRKVSTPRRSDERDNYGALTPRGDDVQSKQKTRTPRQNGETDVVTTRRNSSVKLKQRGSTPRQNSERDVGELINNSSNDLKLKNISTPRADEETSSIKVSTPRIDEVVVAKIGGSTEFDDVDIQPRRGPIWDGRGKDIKETYGGLSPREITQWMGWHDDDIIL